MQTSQTSNTRSYAPRGGRPNYRYQRWTPPPEPKPEPKLDLSDKTFPSLPTSNAPVTHHTAGTHEFQSTFTTTVKVMAEMEKLQELREQREREETQKQRGAMKGVYIDRFQHGRLSAREVEEPEDDEWRPVQELTAPGDDWTEVRHSKARRAPREKSFRELAEEYQAKAVDEEAAEDYNGELFERSHRHDHYAT